MFEDSESMALTFGIKHGIPRINAKKVAVSGKKRTQKLYRRHSGRPGGMKVETFDQLQQRIPERIIEHAVRGMLPKERLGRQLFNHLKVYAGPDHPHEAQKPIELPIRDEDTEATVNSSFRGMPSACSFSFPISSCFC
ncbi:hypothetical protein K7X08_005521 [Anisodus acutangulus]|uniref:Mitochondrial ribosomal protein L13 n=1 Tax=Anisodus acutangulus TaxID=402998 RepID=A0A9Q1LSJ3_9SOLA|nr:hypothetical protein K7X08_005521 [Anisodus acutangulus]